jgi:hypothetical protein
MNYINSPENPCKGEGGRAIRSVWVDYGRVSELFNRTEALLKTNMHHVSAKQKLY